MLQSDFEGRRPISRVLRGGSFNNEAANARSANRISCLASGNGKPPRAVRTVWSIHGVGTGRMVFVTPLNPGSAQRVPWACSQSPRVVILTWKTWRGMSGNGVQTSMTRYGLTAAFCVAARGAALRATAGPRFASTSNPCTVATTSVFVRRGLTPDPLYHERDVVAFVARCQNR